MAICRLSRRAVADWQEIGRFTQLQWGVAQRHKYLAAVETKLRQLAANPQLGISRGDLIPGYRSARVGRHIFFYLVGADGIDVIRILHERMDAEMHIAGGEAQPAEPSVAKRPPSGKSRKR